MPRWMRSMLCSLLAAAFLFARAQAGAAETPPTALPPNVVLIVWDDASHVLAGPGKAAEGPTPRLDALLAEGVRFPRATQVCERGRPSAAALLTGRLPQQNGVFFQSGPKVVAPEGTLPVLLAARGYAGLHVGKFREGAAAEFGFVRELDLGLAPGRDGRAAGEAVAAFVGEFAGQRPLFVWWAPELPAEGGAALDVGLGQLLDALAAHGQAENTLFAFLTNGEPGAKESIARETREERMRNPLVLVRRPALAPAELTARVTPLDLFPTLLEFAGAPVPSTANGRSLAPLLAGAPWEERPVGAAFFPRQPRGGTKGGADPARDLRVLVAYEGRFKYALFLEDIGVRYDAEAERFHIERSAGDQSLYDLEADPAEQHDLFASPEHAERLAALRTAALAWWSASGAHDFPLPFLPPGLGPAPKEPRPNIVLVVADDMDHEHLGFMGNPRVKTPTLDELARTGVVFPVAHVPMSRCRPSLAALLSGRWPHQNGVYDNETARPLARRDSLPNLLKGAGYATFQGGKFWEGSQLSMGFLEPKDVDAVFEDFVRKDQHELFAFVERYHAERPLFVWWAPMLPHVPYDPPERLRKAFADIEIPVPPGMVGDAAEFREAERTLYAMGAWLDEGLAALRTELARQGELENTLFVFLIDNGHANGFPSKGTAFEKGLRTPVVVSWPKGIDGGRTSPELVNTIDLYRTILDYAGIPAPAASAGVSLKPTLDGQAQHTRDALYGALYRYRDRQGPPKVEKDVLAVYARTGRWKFVLYLRDVTPENSLFHHAFAPFPARKRGDRDLFDLQQDPYERRDLAGDSSHAALMDELLQGCLAWWQESGGAALDLP